MKEDKVKKLQKIHRGFSLKPVQFISLGFVAIILLGSFLLSLPWANENGEWCGYTTALFTSTSAVCVTGLAVVDTAVNFSLFGEIVIMLLIQFGGLGFMTIASMLFVIIGKKITLKDRIAIAEAYNQDDLQGMVRLIRMICITTFAIELMGAVLLAFSFIPEFGWGRGAYYSIFHSISAFCNAGFDLMGIIHPGVGLTAFQTDIMCNIGVMLLVVIGGLGFTVIRDIGMKKGNVFRMGTHTKVVLIATGSLFVFGTVMFACLEWNNPATFGGMNPFQKIMAAMFQTITPRTAGFATVDQDALTRGGKMITMLYMFIGASPASTGGGIKSTTFLILIMLFVSGIKGSEQVTCLGRTIARRGIIRTVSLVFFAFSIILLSTLMIAIAEIDALDKSGITLEKVFFECISAFGTVGLSLGITAQLSVFSKIVLIFVMLFGRLGTLSLGLLVFAKKDNINIKYPEAKILIG